MNSFNFKAVSNKYIPPTKILTSKDCLTFEFTTVTPEGNLLPLDHIKNNSFKPKIYILSGVV